MGQFFQLFTLFSLPAALHGEGERTGWLQYPGNLFHLSARTYSLEMILNVKVVMLLDGLLHIPFTTQPLWKYTQITRLDLYCLPLAP